MTTITMPRITIQRSPNIAAATPRTVAQALAIRPGEDGSLTYAGLLDEVLADSPEEEHEETLLQATHADLTRATLKINGEFIELSTADGVKTVTEVQAILETKLSTAKPLVRAFIKSFYNQPSRLSLLGGQVVSRPNTQYLGRNFNWSQVTVNMVADEDGTVSITETVTCQQLFKPKGEVIIFPEEDKITVGSLVTIDAIPGNSARITKASAYVETSDAQIDTYFPTLRDYNRSYVLLDAAAITELRNRHSELVAQLKTASNSASLITAATSRLLSVLDFNLDDLLDQPLLTAQDKMAYFSTCITAIDKFIKDTYHPLTPVSPIAKRSIHWLRRLFGTNRMTQPVAERMQTTEASLEASDQLAPLHQQLADFKRLLLKAIRLSEARQQELTQKRTPAGSTHTDLRERMPPESPSRFARDSTAAGAELGSPARSTSTSAPGSPDVAARLVFDSESDNDDTAATRRSPSPF